MIFNSLIFFSTLILSFLLRAFARKKNLLDIPNSRSSHSIATPKGGGLAIILVFTLTLIYLYINKEISASLFFAFLSVLPISIVSIIDDIYEVSAKLRLGVQIISAVLALYALGGVNSVCLGTFVITGTWLNVLAFFTIIWLSNLYNFLDGLDGYAASEAIIVGLSAFFLFDNDLGLYLALSTAGFLVFNWPKASFFMGDVGSASLGFIFAILLLSDVNSPHFLGWIVLLSLFWFDATITLFRRYRNGEKISQAHKKHMYQRLNQSGWSHQKVLVSSILFNTVLAVALFIVNEQYYLYLLGSTLLVLWAILKYVDKQKGFE